MKLIKSAYTAIVTITPRCNMIRAYAEMIDLKIELLHQTNYDRSDM